MATWFDKLSPAAQKAYIKSHPNSKYAKGKKISGSTNKKNFDTKFSKVVSIEKQIKATNKLAPSLAKQAKLKKLRKAAASAKASLKLASNKSRAKK